MYAYYLIGSNENDCSSHGSSSYGYTDGNNRWSHTTIAVTDNNTNAGTRGGANDSSNVVTEPPLIMVKVQNLESTLLCVDNNII